MGYSPTTLGCENWYETPEVMSIQWFVHNLKHKRCKPSCLSGVRKLGYKLWKFPMLWSCLLFSQVHTIHNQGNTTTNEMQPPNKVGIGACTLYRVLTVLKSTVQNSYCLVPHIKIFITGWIKGIFNQPTILTGSG